jgi:hypothetical protein
MRISSARSRSSASLRATRACSTCRSRVKPSKSGSDTVSDIEYGSRE